MIVTCEACETQFQLDDAKVPEGGVRVRCSRCKHAFHIESPQRAAADEAEDLARDALTAPTSPGVESDSTESGLEDGESDWQFNEETIPPAGAEETPRVSARDAVDDLLGSSAPPSSPPAAASEIGAGLGGDAGSFEDLDSGDLGVGGMDLGGSDVQDPMEDFGSIPGDLSADPEDDPNAITIDHAAAAAASLDLAPPEAEAEAGSPGAEADAGDSLSDLGSPDDWNFFDSEADAAGESASRGTPLARIVRDVPTEAEHIRAERADRAATGEAEDAVAAPNAWMAWGKEAVGWGLVVALGLYAAVTGLAPSLGGAPPVLAARPLAGLEAEEVEGRWVENGAVGPLFVVSGWLRAASEAPAEARSQLRVRLLDRNGVALVSESAAVGPPVREEQLREWNLPDLREFHAERARKMTALSLKPGERRRFQAILGAVPQGAAAFEFQAVAVTNPAPPESAHEAAPYHDEAMGAGAMIPAGS